MVVGSLTAAAIVLFVKKYVPLILLAAFFMSAIEVQRTPKECGEYEN